MTTERQGVPERLPPVHPEEISQEEFLLPLNISHHRLAKSIGVDPRRAHAIVHGERGISAETELLFSRSFGNSAGFRMELRGRRELEVAEKRLGERC